MAEDLENCFPSLQQISFDSQHSDSSSRSGPSYKAHAFVRKLLSLPQLKVMDVQVDLHGMVSLLTRSCKY